MGLLSNNENYRIRVHERRRPSNSREPEYIENGYDRDAVGVFGQSRVDFFLGFRRKERVSFRIGDLWCYVDDPNFYNFITKCQSEFYFSIKEETMNHLRQIDP